MPYVLYSWFTRFTVIECRCTAVFWTIKKYHLYIKIFQIPVNFLREAPRKKANFGNCCAIFIIHLGVCLTTGPKPLPKRALHIVRSRASSFKWKYPLLSLRSSNSFLRLLPCLPVTSIPPCIFPSVTRCRRQFLRKMWPCSSPSVYVFHVGYSSAPWL